MIGNHKIIACFKLVAGLIIVPITLLFEIRFLYVLRPTWPTPRRPAVPEGSSQTREARGGRSCRRIARGAAGGCRH